MLDRSDAGKVGCWTVGMLDLGIPELGMPERKDARKKGYGKGGVQERRDMGKVGFTVRDRGCRKDGIQDMWDSK